MPRCLRSEFLRLITGRRRRHRLTQWTANFLEGSRGRSSNHELRKRGDSRSRKRMAGPRWRAALEEKRQGEGSPGERTTFYRDPSEFLTNFSLPSFHPSWTDGLRFAGRKLRSCLEQITQLLWMIDGVFGNEEKPILVFPFVFIVRLCGSL